MIRGCRVPGSAVCNTERIAPPIRATLGKIMKDEGWHIQWVSKTLEAMKPVYGEEAVAAAVKRYADADREVYQRTLAEHDEIVQSLNHFKAA